MRTAYTDQLGATMSRVHKEAFPGHSNLEFARLIDGVVDTREENGCTSFLMPSAGHLYEVYSYSQYEWYVKM